MCRHVHEIAGAASLAARTWAGAPHPPQAARAKHAAGMYHRDSANPAFGGGEKAVDASLRRSLGAAQSADGRSS